MRVPCDPLKHRIFDLTQVAFWVRQEAENELKVTCDPIKHSFLDFTKVALCSGQGKKMSSQ